MKISESALKLDYQYQKTSSQASLTSSSVRILNAAEPTDANIQNTNNSRARVSQKQQQTLTDSITSSSKSVVINSESDQTHYFESTQLIQSISSVFVEESMTVISSQYLGASSGGIAKIEVTSMSQFESDTQVQAQALGAITTDDGREIQFLLELDYQRNIKTSQESSFTGHRDLIDPLVLNLNGGAPALSSGYFEFDLNSDGTKETLNRTEQGTGFLALDKNQNGEIDNGQELFGPNSFSGFGELARYDDDKNGWIDENDAIFSQLSYMNIDANGEQNIQSITDVGLGAIYLGSKKMDLDLFDKDGNFQANIARNGVALKENGQAVSLQEIHYSDQAIGKPSLEKASSIDLSSFILENTQSAAINTDNNSTRRLTENVPLVQIESPLTQFQFDNDIINARNAETHVRITQDEQQNFITLDGIRMRFSNNITATDLGSGTSINMRFGNAIQPSNTHTEHSHDHTSNESPLLNINNPEKGNIINSHHRNDVQAIFKARMEAGFTISNVSQVSSGSQPYELIDVPTLSQSVFWQDERHQYQNAYDGGSKLDQLKQLVEDLKIIREQNMKNQDKLGLYIKIGNAQ